jgi:hypothetical protein
MSARRVLGVLECVASDDAVLARAVDVASESGGYLTLVAIVPPVWLWNPGPHCVPTVSPDELREQAARVLRRAAKLVPPEIPLLTALEEGKAADVIARRVATAAHDVVVVRRCRRLRRVPARLAPVSVLAVGA